MDKKTIIQQAVDFDLIGDKTLYEVEKMDFAIRKAGGVQRAGIELGQGLAAMALWEKIKALRFTHKAADMKVKDFIELANKVRLGFIQQHIINYAAHFYFLDFRDYLFEKKMLTRGTEKYWRKAERCFDDYQKAQKVSMDEKSWMLFLDHMSVCYWALSEQIEVMEDVIRDYLIQHRKDIEDTKQKDDITVLKKAAVCFLLLSVMQASYRDYFETMVKDYGVDFQGEFKYAELTNMLRNAKWFCQTMGIKFSADKDGDEFLAGVNIGDSVRVCGEWKKLVDMFSDEYILDNTAMEAIKMNPEANAEYEARQQQREDEAMEEKLSMLKEKYQ